MPWKALQRGDEWCVYKLNDDNEPDGDAIACHATMKEARDHVKALYANAGEEDVAEFGNSLDDFVQRVRDEFVRVFSHGDELGIEQFGWVADVFPDHAIVRRGVKYYEVYFTDDGQRITFSPIAEWKPVDLKYVPVSESHAEDTPKDTVLTEMVSEFKGGFPEVKPASGVNFAELIAGDADPMFLTVPISRVGEVSKNGLVHTEAFAKSLVEQINRDRPGGLMGHLRDEERSTAHPVAAIHWIGAILHNGMVWAKGYIPRTQVEVREEYRIAKAKGGKVATSVYGRAFKETDSGGKGTWIARDFDLESIDLAPYKRAALPGSGEFYLTREMSGSANVSAPAKGNDEMDKSAIIAELTVADLPKALKDAVVAEYAEGQQIAELQAQHEVLKAKVSELEAERGQLQQKIAEFEAAEAQRVAEQEAREFDMALSAKIAELINWPGEDERVKGVRDAMRRQMKLAVLTELNGVREAAKVEETLQRVWDAEFKTIAETVRANLAGPAAVVSGKKPQAAFNVDDSPEAIARARAKFGI